MPVLVKNCSPPLDHVCDSDCGAGICTCWLLGEEVQGGGEGDGASCFLEEVKVKSLSRVRLFATPRTVAYQAPPSMGFSLHGILPPWDSPSMGLSRQEYWSGLPFPSPGDLPDLGIEPGSPTFQANA